MYFLPESLLFKILNKFSNNFLPEAQKRSLLADILLSSNSPFYTFRNTPRKVENDKIDRNSCLYVKGDEMVIDLIFKY